MMWQRLFASQEASIGNFNLMQGTASAPMLYFGRHRMIPGAVRLVFLIPVLFLPLFACIWVQSRSIDAAQPMFEDKPYEHPPFTATPCAYWRSAVSVAGLGLTHGRSARARHRRTASGLAW